MARIAGPVGWLVWFGQLLAGDTSRYTHVWLMLDNGDILEAEPGGAKIKKFADTYAKREAVFCDKPVADTVMAWSKRQIDAGEFPTIRERLAYEESLRARIVATGREYEGAPYSFLSYVYIGLRRLGFRGNWLRRRIQNINSHICSSVVVDGTYYKVDVHLFHDGDDRWLGEVTPGDLARYAKGSLTPIK